MEPAKFKDDCSAAFFVILRSHSILIESKQMIENERKIRTFFSFQVQNNTKDVYTHCVCIE